jgi:hypothetical protein
MSAYVILRSLVKQVSRDDFLHNLFFDLLPQLLGGDGLAVLGTDDYGIDSDGDDGPTVVFILDCDLRLRVGSQPR